MSHPQSTFIVLSYSFHVTNCSASRTSISSSLRVSHAYFQGAIATRASKGKLCSSGSGAATCDECLSSSIFFNLRFALRF